LLYKYAKSDNDNLILWLEERIYKLERDEAAFLQSIKNINSKQSTSINQFLMHQQRNAAVPTHEDFIKKKKVHQQTREIVSTTLKLSDLIQQAIARSTQQLYSQPIEVTMPVDAETTVLGTVTINVN